MTSAVKDSTAQRSAGEADRKLAVTALQRLAPVNGYAETFSVFAGETVHIRAACRPVRNPFKALRRPRVKTVEIRDAVTDREVDTWAVPAGMRLLRQIPANYRDEGAFYACRIPVETGELDPGVYECVIHDSTGERSRDIFFNVKPRAFKKHDLVCVLPTFTWQAYNRIAGGSFYSNSLGPVRTISTQRPMSRIGDNAMDAALPFLAAFAGEGARVVCVDSADLHFGRLPEGRVPVMALLTHDEYWSAPMRAQVDAFLAHGGTLLVLAGNVCWWKIGVDGHNLTVDKKQSLTGGQQWYQQGAPEERTFVSSYRFGGYAVERAKRKPKRSGHLDHLPGAEHDDAGGIIVEKPSHPIFRGVALDKDNRFGAEVPILYREIDAVPLTADGGVDRMWYDADDVKPRVLATGLVVLGRLFHSKIAKAGIVVEADVGGGHVVHMGSFGWSLGLVQKNAGVKQVVLNAYEYCRGLAESGGARKSRKRRKDAPG